MTGKKYSYDSAFSRNLGLISSKEQEILRQARVAILGLGGVGGIDLVALARLGIGKFTIADPDYFEMENSNRQYGAMYSNYGKSKAEVMAEVLKEINPEIEVRIFKTPIGSENVDAFLEGANAFVDAVDAFEIDVRRLIFAKAREKGIFAVGAGPVGFSTAWVSFSPQGMSFDKYFDLSDTQNAIEKFAAYITGMAPAATQRSYMDLSHFSFNRRRGPSSSLACHLASGVVAAEVLKSLLGRGGILSAPHYQQFDPFVGKYVRGVLRWGNRGLIQRLKRLYLTRFISLENRESNDNIHKGNGL